MEQMQEIKKKHLRSYQVSLKNAERIKDELEESKMRKSIQLLDKDRVGRKEAIHDYEKQVEKVEGNLKVKLEECREICSRIISEIEDMDSQEEKDVLFYHYVKNMTWEEVGKKLNMSVRKVHYIHREAIRNIKIKEK